MVDIADELEAEKLFRFADQLRAATLSMPNNIAEGSGSNSNREFGRFISYARCSAFENANMIIIFARRNYIDTTFSVKAQLRRSSSRETTYPPGRVAKRIETRPSMLL